MPNPRRTVVIEIFAPTEGMHKEIGESMLTLRATPNVGDCNSFYGAVQKEYGTTLFVTGTVPNKPIMIYEANFAAQPVLEVFTNTGMYKLAAGAFTNDGQVYAGTYWDVCMHNDAMVYCNGADLVQYKPTYSATGTTMGGVASDSFKAFAVVSFKEHLNLYHTYESGNECPKRVRWTKVGLLAYATADWGTGTAGFVDLQDADGDILTAKALGMGAVAIYAENSIHVQEWVGGSDVYRFTKVLSNVNIPTRSCLAAKGSLHYVLTRDGVYEYRGGNDFVEISGAIKRDFVSVINASNMQSAFLQYTPDDDELRVHVPTGNSTTPDRVYICKLADSYAWYQADRTYTAHGKYTRQTALTIGELQGNIGAQNWKFGDMELNAGAPTYLLGDFLDNSNSAKTVTAVDGAVLDTAQKKFGTASLLLDNAIHLLIHFDGDDAATTYTAETGQTVTFEGTAQLDVDTKKFGSASLLLDGNSDYVTVPDSANWDFAAGDFTIDCWAYLDEAMGTARCLASFGGGVNNWNTTNGIEWMFSIEANEKLYFGYNDAGSGVNCYSTEAIDVDAGLHHFSVIRNGNTLTLRVDGVTVGTSDMTGVTITSIATPTNLEIGHQIGVGEFWKGWIDEPRISKGVARWVADFTPPVAAYGAPSYCTVPDSDDWNFSIGDFTIELWCRFFDITTQDFMGLVSQYADANNRWQMYYDKTGGLKLYIKSGSTAKVVISEGSVTGYAVNTQYHIALVRYGNTWTFYREGTAVATATDSVEMPDIAAVLTIGRLVDASSYMAGWIDDVRISKGIARYTANFTAPVAPLTPDSYTKLLLHCNGSNGSTTITDSAADKTGRVVKRDKTVYSIYQAGETTKQDFVFDTKDISSINDIDPMLRDRYHLTDYMDSQSRWLRTVVEAKGEGSMYLQYSLDNGSTFTYFPESPKTLGTAWTMYKFDLDVASERIMIRVLNSGTNEVVHVRYIKLEFVPGVPGGE